MKLVIDIPKEFEEEWYADKFTESLKRIECDLKGFSSKGRVSGRYEEETIEMMQEAFKNGKTLLNTTNGAMFLTVFPDARKSEFTYTYSEGIKLPYHTKHDTGLLFDKEWWNAPYKGGETE